MPQLPLSAKQIYILVQALVLAKDELLSNDVAKKAEIEQLRNLFQNVKDV